MKNIKGLAVLLVRTVAVGLMIFVFKVLADPPLLTIAPLGSNQFSVVITNGIDTTNYTLFWTPLLANTNYPWEVLGVGEVGQTNFIIDAGTWPTEYYRVLVGADSDGDGVPDWEDADPSNPNIGILAVTIDSPLNGAVLQ